MSEDILKEQAEFEGVLNEGFRCPFCGAAEFHSWPAITRAYWIVECRSRACAMSWQIVRNKKEEIFGMLERAKVAGSWEEKYREKEQESRDHCDKIAALMSGGAGDR